MAHEAKRTGDVGQVSGTNPGSVETGWRERKDGGGRGREEGRGGRWGGR